MEDRSSRRMRTLVTRMVHRDLSAKKNAGALISMMARSTNRSNQRPDTLMQDRKPPDRRNLLRRTAGPYIRVNRYRSLPDKNRSMSAMPRKRRRAVKMSPVAMGQCTKSLRDSVQVQAHPERYLHAVYSEIIDFSPNPSFRVPGAANVFTRIN